MKIIDVHQFKIPDFLMPALNYGDITDLTPLDEEARKQAIKEFEELCSEDEQYVVAIIKSGQKSYFCDKPSFTDIRCDVYDVLVTIFK